MRFAELLPFAGVSLKSVGETFNSLALEDRSASKTEAFPVLFSRNGTNSNNGSTTTVNMFIDDGFAGQAGYAASVVTACADQTIYALQCTSGMYVGTDTCGPNAPTLTITSASTTYAGDYTVATTILGTYATLSLTEGCKLAGTTAATCAATVSASGAGEHTESSVVETLLGSDYHRFNVLITGGAEKLAAATVTCASKPNAAPGVDIAAIVARGIGYAGAVLCFLLM